MWFFLILLSFSVYSIDPPSDAKHPGSFFYETDFEIKTHTCGDSRSATVYLPKIKNENTPTIVFGHGQSLNISHYEKSLSHIAKKGVAVIFPNYGTWAFDTNWLRMGADYISQAKCIIESEDLNKELVVFSGHSKGAYVASVASGLSFKNDLLKPKSLLLMNAAGFEASLIPFIPKNVEVNLVFSEEDTIVEKSISEEIFKLSQADKKQFILLKSYPESSNEEAFNAIHMWPLNKPFLFFGGGPIGPLHYYGFWKWMIAAADDLNQGAQGESFYLYGEGASDKGIDGLKDEVIRSWQ